MLECSTLCVSVNHALHALEGGFLNVGFSFLNVTMEFYDSNESHWPSNVNINGAPYCWDDVLQGSNFMQAYYYGRGAKVLTPITFFANCKWQIKLIFIT